MKKIQTTVYLTAKQKKQYTDHAAKFHDTSFTKFMATAAQEKLDRDLLEKEMGL